MTRYQESCGGDDDDVINMNYLLQVKFYNNKMVKDSWQVFILSLSLVPLQIYIHEYILYIYLLNESVFCLSMIWLLMIIL